MFLSANKRAEGEGAHKLRVRRVFAHRDDEVREREVAVEQEDEGRSCSASAPEKVNFGSEGEGMVEQHERCRGA